MRYMLEKNGKEGQGTNLDTVVRDSLSEDVISQVEP